MDEQEPEATSRPDGHEMVARVWKYSQLSDDGRLWFAHAWAISQLNAMGLPVPAELVAEFHALDARWNRSLEQPVGSQPQEYAGPEQAIRELSPVELELLAAGRWYRPEDVEARRLLLRLACVRFGQRQRNTPKRLLTDLEALGPSPSA